VCDANSPVKLEKQQGELELGVVTTEGSVKKGSWIYPGYVSGPEESKSLTLLGRIFVKKLSRALL
jgi:hypothetical protein